MNITTKRQSGNGEQSTPPEGFWVHPHGLHTSVPIVVRGVEFVTIPAGPSVLVTATIGESESNEETIRFHMTHEQALAADIIGRRK